MAASPSPFADYKFLSLPDLSTLRHPPRSRDLTSIQVHPDCTERLLLVALARCLGAYCSSNDVLLGWQPADSKVLVKGNRLTAARVSWDSEEATSWEDVLRGVTLKETEDDPACIHRDLGFEFDSVQSTFLAIVSANLDYDHPLVVSLDSVSSECDKVSTIRLKHSTLSFHASTAKLLATQLCEVVAHIIAHPRSNPRSLSFLAGSLQSAVPLSKGGSSYTHYPEVRTVADLIPRHDPSLVALEFYPDLYEEDYNAYEHGAQHLTYGELHSYSNRFAAYLCAQGLELEDRVTLCMPRGVEFLISMLGVLKAGGCYVPIDPELPKERQEFIVSDSGARFVLTTENIQSHIADSRAFPPDDVDKPLNDGLAYLLYTSGTTGTPKGCLLTHDGFVQAIHALSWFANQAGPNRRRWPQAGRYLAVASIAFDVHLAETFVCLSLGMTLVSAPRSQLLEDLPQWLQLLRITHVGIVPSLIEATMHAVTESVEQSASESRSSVENAAMELAYIASGGEKMSDSILERWADHSCVSLANFYGPSEVTIGCSARFMTSNARKESIGRIFENCSAYVVNENLEIVIRGGVGELLVGGRLVGRGYHGRPDLTDKAFIYWNDERVYRTGDMVRLMPDDTFEIMGRIDTQIKLRGVRIEAEGVSSVIRNAAIGFPGLSSNSTPEVSTVLAHHPSLRTDQLVSFIAWDSSVSIACRRSTRPNILKSVPPELMHTLKSACARELASYMRPAHIVPLNFLPLNSNGKTDGKMLVALFQGESLEILGRIGTGKDDSDNTGENARNRPLDDVERKIADIVARFTAVPRERLTPLSNLFELGLDSLKIVRLGSELRTLSGPGSFVSVSNLMRHPTVEGLATLIKAGQSSETETERESFVVAFSMQWKQEIEETFGMEMVESVLPTFPVQDGVLYRSSDFKTLYVQHIALKIHEDVDVERLRNAWKMTMSRHEILRTVFHFSSALVQIVLKASSCELPWQEHVIQKGDLSNFSSNFVENNALELARDINENVTAVPPFRLIHHRLEGSTASFVTLSIHHSIYDGVSLPHLLSDVEKIYSCERLRPPAPLSKVLDAIYNVDLDSAASFWINMFDGFDWSRVPRRLAAGETANTCSVQFTMEGLQGWETKAAKAKVSLQALLTASFGVCLGNHIYGSSDVVLGVIRSGRTFSTDEMNDAQAPLLSVLPTRVNFSKDTSVLQCVQQNIGGALAYEHVPLRRVQQWLQPGRSLFEALLSISNDNGNNMKIWDMLQSSQPQADYILAVEMVLDRKTGKIRVDCAYTEPMSQDLISRLLASVEETASILVEGHRMPSARVAPIPVIQTTDDSDDEEIDSLGNVDHILEEKVRTLVSQFLKIEIDQISATTSLFSLGLDSIKSVGLARELRRNELKITAMELMRRPFIRRIATCQTENASVLSIRNAEDVLLREIRAEISKVNEKVVPLSGSDKVELYPVTALQAGMLSQTIGSGGHLYVHAFPFRLSAGIDLERLKRAWESAVQFFATLRTSFHYLSLVGSWIQAIHSTAELKWSEVGLPADKSILGSIEDYITSIDFSSESRLATPPIYLQLYRGTGESGTPHTLVLVIHHALYDGISMLKLSDVLWKYYAGEAPAPTPQFVDLLGYFMYQERNGTDYWTRQLQDYRRPAISRPVSTTESHASTLPSPSSSSSWTIPFTSAHLSEACRLFDTTVQCFGQASMAIVLAKLYNSRDIVFGHVVSGRNVAKAEDVLGPMISTLPCRVRISQSLKNLDLVRSVHRNNISAQKWQHASLRSIQRKLGLGSLWDSIFIFQPLTDDASGSEDRLWCFDNAEDEVAKIQYPLNIELHQFADRLIIKAACQTDMLSGVDLDDVLKEFSETFSIIVNQPSNIALPELPIDNTREKTGDQVNGHLNSSADPSPQKLDPQLSTFVEILATSTSVPQSSIRLDTPLISLGIDSISAIQVSSRARQVGLNIHAADILRCQRPVDLLDILKEKESKTVHQDHEQSPMTRLEPKDSLLRCLGTSADMVEEIALASAGMKWLIGMWQLSGRSRFQHAFAFGLPSDVDEGKFKSAWRSLVKSHAILRSTFASINTADVHIVTFKDLPADRLWTSRDVRDDKPANETISTIMKGLVSSPLSTDLPPVQAIFLRCHGSNYFIMHLHHFQYDAWSLRLLVEDLRHLYLGEPMVGSGKLALFLQKCNSLSHKEEQRRYWQSYLPIPFAPSLLPKISAEKEYARFVYIDPKALRDLPSLRNRAQDLSLSLSAVLLACWARVQAEYSQTNSATFGLWHFGRSGVIDEATVSTAPCMNVLPVHVDAIRPSLRKLSGLLQGMLRQRSAIVEQSHLEDISRWCSGDDRRTLLNVFVNIVATVESEDSGFNTLMSPINMPYYLPNLPPPETRQTAKRLAVCDLIEEAVVVEFVAAGHNMIASVEYTGNYLDMDKCRQLVTAWVGFVNETLKE
ncbi:hypothetical protein M0805_008982 [Coniferiporia weirii]|nr:hypothetical protein M0805_008982 [Coniferiporia weirii]